MAITTDELRAVNLLESLDQRELARLAAGLRERECPAGKVIVREGKGGIGFFLVLEGRATVTIRGEERGHLGPGDSFGELALFDMQADRAATITAETDVRCAGMTAWEFKPFVLEHPQVAWSMLTLLARRVREAEERAASSPLAPA